jgi:hypothetical protein
MTTRLHGNHSPALSDGFADDMFFQDQSFRVIYSVGESFDYFHPQTDVGVGITGFGSGQPQPGERPSTLWYHDHLIDFTGSNNYHGLQGTYLVFDELDSANEQDPDPAALRLPSGPFDIPLILGEKRFAADGSLVFASSIPTRSSTPTNRSTPGCCWSGVIGPIAGRRVLR